MSCHCEIKPRKFCHIRKNIYYLTNCFGIVFQTFSFFVPLQLVLKNEVTLYYNSRHIHNSSGGNVFKILKVLFGFATGVRFLPIILTKEYFWNNSGWSKQQTRSCFSYFWSIEYDAGHHMLHKMADRSVRL